jgi:hypothetical protein
VFFMFEISPILVQMKESRRSVSTTVAVYKTTGLGSVRPLCAGCLLFCTDHGILCLSGLQRTMPNHVLQTSQILHTLSYRRLRYHRGDLHR